MKSHNLKERISDWLNQPIKTGWTHWMAEHRKLTFGIVFSIPIIYVGIKDLALPVFYNYREQAAIEQRKTEQRSISRLPRYNYTLADEELTYNYREQAAIEQRKTEQRSISRLPRYNYTLADEELTSYLNARPIKFHRSKTRFDLEANVGEGYNLFFMKKGDCYCMHLQSTKIEQQAIGDCQLATIIMLDEKKTIQSISQFFSYPFDKSSPDRWTGEGIPFFEMMKNQKGTGLVITDYRIPGWGINQLYPHLQFPEKYQTLVHEVTRDLEKEK